jgi:hypothetical protein
MRHTLGSVPILLILLLVLEGFEPSLSAQDAPLTPQELDQLLSPVALYPDSLLPHPRIRRRYSTSTTGSLRIRASPELRSPTQRSNRDSTRPSSRW